MLLFIKKHAKNILMILQIISFLALQNRMNAAHPSSNLPKDSSRIPLATDYLPMRSKMDILIHLLGPKRHELQLPLDTIPVITSDMRNFVEAYEKLYQEQGYGRKQKDLDDLSEKLKEELSKASEPKSSATQHIRTYFNIPKEPLAVFVLKQTPAFLLKNACTAGLMGPVAMYYMSRTAIGQAPVQLIKSFKELTEIRTTLACCDAYPPRVKGAIEYYSAVATSNQDDSHAARRANEIVQLLAQSLFNQRVFKKGVEIGNFMGSQSLLTGSSDEAVTPSQIFNHAKACEEERRAAKKTVKDIQNIQKKSGFPQSTLTLGKQLCITL